jgi:hypothetical protein
VDDRGGVEHRRARADPVEEPVGRGRVAHVADHDLDCGRQQREGGDVVVYWYEAPHPFAVADEGPHQVLAQPARGAGDHGGRRGV